MDLAHENGRRNKHLDVCLELFDEIESSKQRSEGKDVDLMDDDKDSDHSYILNREYTEPVRAKPEIFDGDSRNHSAKRLEAASSSSSSPDLSLNDLCQVDTSQVNISLPRTSIPQEAQPASKIDENSGINPLNMQDDSSGPTSTSQSSDISQQAEIQGLPLTLNPPTQVMDRSGGYDPNRIPSSVFAANPLTPMDWSLASNESLFSIHVGDSSFSRDTKFSLDGLGKPEELVLKESGELSLYSPTLQVPQIDNDERKNDKMENEFGTTGRGGETITEQPTESEQQTEVKRKRSGVTWKFSNLSVPSHGSGNSGKSFAFPILTDGGKNSSSKAYIERYYSASPMKTTTSTRSRCCSCCCCCSCACCYCSSCPSCPSCRSCFVFCKSISCSHHC